MVFYLNNQHPRDLLVFYIASQPGDEAAERLGRWIDQIGREKTWVLQSPYFIHQEEDVTDPRTGKKVVTVGGVLEFYSAHPPWRDVLPVEVDRAHFEECSFVVGELCGLSQAHGYEFHFEFQGELVGTIKEGVADEALREQFLGSWGRAVGVHDAE